MDGEAIELKMVAQSMMILVLARKAAKLITDRSFNCIDTICRIRADNHQPEFMVKHEERRVKAILNCAIPVFNQRRYASLT